MSNQRADAVERWSCKFLTPSPDDLMSGLGEDLRPVVAHARATLRAMDGVRELVRWQGIPWRWTFTYQAAGSTGPAEAYVIPCPREPRLAIPLAKERICSLRIAQLPPTVRSGIAAGRRVGNALWCEWILTDAEQTDSILNLVGPDAAAEAIASQGSR